MVDLVFLWQSEHCRTASVALPIAYGRMWRGFAGEAVIAAEFDSMRKT